MTSNDVSVSAPFWWYCRYSGRYCDSIDRTWLSSHKILSDGDQWNPHQPRGWGPQRHHGQVHQVAPQAPGPSWHQPHSRLAQDQQLQGQRQVCADQVRHLRQERLGQLPPAEGVHGNAGLQVWQQCQCRHKHTCTIQLYKYLYRRTAVYSYWLLMYFM